MPPIIPAAAPGLAVKSALASLHRLGLALLLVMAAAALGASPAHAQSASERVLITNDNGIDDPRLIALAHAFAAAGAEVWVSAPAENRSGFTNFAPATGAGLYRVRSVDLGPGVRAYAVDGAPTDAVIFAVTGPMREMPPTLVVSGINGGANAGDGWVGSGTVGAARTAAGIGFRAVAVSGVPSHPANHHRIAADWVVEFTRSRMVRELEAPDYLTISFPEMSLDQVREPMLTPRATHLIDASATVTGQDDGWEEWTLARRRIAEPAPGSDLDVMARGHIAVVPMRVGDMDGARLASLLDRPGILPTWTAPAPNPVCPIGVGVEDVASGARINQIVEAGTAQQAGLRIDDIIVRIGDTDIRSTPSPTGTMAETLSSIDCGREVAIDVHRDGQPVRFSVQRLAS